MFSSNSFIGSDLIIKSLTHLELILIYDVRQGSKFFFFAYGYSDILIAFIKGTSFLKKLCVLGTFVQNKLTIKLWIYFWALFCSIGLHVYFYARTMVNYHHFVI